MAIRNEEDLGEALKTEQDTIVIEGDLVRKVLRIKATGKVAWAVAIGGIAISVTVVIATGGAGAPASALVAGSAIAILGLPAALSAISIAVAAGGVATLNSLRSYRIADRSESRLILKRR